MMRFKPEQIVTVLQQIEVEIANGKTTPQACKEAEITDNLRQSVRLPGELEHICIGKTEIIESIAMLDTDSGEFVEA